MTLHSVCENLDLASGRWFFDDGRASRVLPRELVENVRMGLRSVVKEGRWTNRPKTGYDMIEGLSFRTWMPRW